MRKNYQFLMEGTGRKDGQMVPWLTEGKIVDVEWHSVFPAVMEATFQQLTNGDAQYGRPGEGGCSGPYDITGLTIREVKQ